MARHDVAIYAPEAAGLYERGGSATGGAEVQTLLIAQGLAARGLSIAHIVFPVANLNPPSGAQVSVVQRLPYEGDRRVAGKASESRRIVEALRRADARVYVLRMSTPALAIAAMFCRSHRRKLIFSSANDLDFTFEGLSKPLLPLYKLGVRLADAVVLQSEQQRQLVNAAFPRLGRLAVIPSFAQLVEGAPRAGAAFLWMGRLVDYKRPLRYLELAEAVPEARFRMIAWPTGETSEDLATEFRRRAESLPNVDLLPPRPRREVLQLVEEAVAIVSTSRLEGMPNVFLEGWARGIPSLTLEFDPDGLVEREALGVSARGSWQRFVEGARQLWQLRHGRGELSERVRRYVESRHSPAAVTERWLDVIASVDPEVRAR